MMDTVTCPTCDDGRNFDHICPDCGWLGVVPAEHVIEAAAEAVYNFDEVSMKPPYWTDCTPDMVAWYREAGRAALVAALHATKQKGEQ